MGFLVGFALGLLPLLWLGAWHGWPRRAPRAPRIGETLSWEDEGFTHTGVFVGWDPGGRMRVRLDDGSGIVGTISKHHKARVLPERGIVEEAAANYREAAARKAARKEEP